MTRVALIAGSYQPERCGVAHYTAHIRDFLCQHDVESVVLTTNTAAQSTKDPRVLGVVNDWRLADLVPLVRAIQTTIVDILHIQHAAGTYGFQRPIFLLPLLLRAWGYQKPIVTTIHEYGWWEWQPGIIPPRLLEWLKQWGQQHGWWDREDGFLLTGSTAIITTNVEAEVVMRQRLPYLANRMYRIPIGANVEIAPIDRYQARQQLRQRYGWSPDTLVAVFFGFLHPVKGIETLLAALPQILLANKPQVRLLLIGGVESLALPAEQAQLYWDKLHKLIAELNLSQQVQLTGYLKADLASHYLSGADIGVLPFNHGVTLKSGSLLSLFAHGLPVVATQSQPPDPDLAEPEIVLVPPCDVDALATAMLELLHDSVKRDRLGKTGRSFVQRFTWSAIAQQHRDIYRNLVLNENR